MCFITPVHENQVLLFIENRPSYFSFAYGTWSMSNCMDSENLGVCNFLWQQYTLDNYVQNMKKLWILT